MSPPLHRGPAGRGIGLLILLIALIAPAACGPASGGAPSSASPPAAAGTRPSPASALAPSPATTSQTAAAPGGAAPAPAASAAPSTGQPNRVAVEKYTVKVELKAPFSPFLDRTANNALAIVNRKAVEAAGANYTQRPVGTGPFKFVEWRTGDRAIVEKNPDNWGSPKPALDRVVFRPIPDTNTRLSECESGGIDYMMELPNAEIDRLRREGRIQVQVVPTVNVSYIAYNMQKPRFKDNVKLRQAINYAIDRDEIVNTIYCGTGLPAISPVNPGNWAHNPEVNRYPFDPATAKRLYQESGYSGEPIELAISDQPDVRATAERVQAQVKEVLGLDITLKVLEWGGFLNYLRAGNHQMCSLGWSGATDPDGILYPTFHSKNWGAGGNRAFYTNEQVDELLSRAQVTVNQAERRQVYMEAQRIIMTTRPGSRCATA